MEDRGAASVGEENSVLSLGPSSIMDAAHINMSAHPPAEDAAKGGHEWQARSVFLRL